MITMQLFGAGKILEVLISRSRKVWEQRGGWQRLDDQCKSVLSLVNQRRFKTSQDRAGDCVLAMPQRDVSSLMLRAFKGGEVSQVYGSLDSPDQLEAPMVQVNGCMKVASEALGQPLQWCDLFLWTPRQQTCRRMLFDEDLWERAMQLGWLG